MKIYKFVKAEHAAAFAEGVIRISPASHFRFSDDRNGGQGDQGELVFAADVPNEYELRPDHPFYPRGVFLSKTKDGWVEQPMVVTADKVQIFMNALLFCATHTVSAEVCRGMQRDFGADALFEISDVNEFAREIHSNTFLRDRDCQHGQVSYDLRDGPIQLIPTPSFFTKELQYSWQNEYRLVWPYRAEPEPFLLKIPRIKQFLRRLY